MRRCADVGGRFAYTSSTIRPLPHRIHSLPQTNITNFPILGEIAKLGKMVKLVKLVGGRGRMRCGGARMWAEGLPIPLPPSAHLRIAFTHFRKPISLIFLFWGKSRNWGKW